MSWIPVKEQLPEWRNGNSDDEKEMTEIKWELNASHLNEAFMK